MKTISTALSLVALLACALAHGAVPSGARRQGALSEQERRGKLIYTRGESAAGREIVAVVAEVDVPGSKFACATCHGTKGEGKSEGGVTAGNLTWSNLLKPAGHTHPTGRRHGPFDEASFARSLKEGVDPDDNLLAVAMPRYRMSPEDVADLVAYLKRIESDEADATGVTAGSIKIGTVLPSTGPLAASGAAMREVLAAYFEELNSRGGVHNRKIELRVAEAGASPSQTAENVRALVEREQVFAIVGGIIAGAEDELWALESLDPVPFVGPSTLLPEDSDKPAREVFYLMPGVREQARALVNFAASRPGLKGARAVIVSADEGLVTAAISPIEEQAKKVGFAAPSLVTYARGKFDAARAVAEAKQGGAAVVFLLGEGAANAAFLREAASKGWTPHVFLLGILAGGDLAASATPAFKDKIFVAFPSVPGDVSQAGGAEFAALLEKYKIERRQAASQLAALASAKVFAEGLKRAGRDLTRDAFVNALEGLYDYETGVTPRVSFGPNRRVGAAGAYVVALDAEAKSFVPVGGWVKAN